LGIESRGAVRWLEIAGFRIQFSEILKPFLAISLASFLSSGDYSLKKYLSIFILLFPIAFLIFAQPDLGNALIYFIAVSLALLIYGFSLRYFVVSMLMGVGALPFFWFILHDYQKQRLLTFLNPSNDPLGTSYNAIQSTIAVGSGNLFGKGLGQATQSALNFLPENHTDFIFATISESLGLIGAFIVIVAFAFLLYRIYTMLGEGHTFSKNFTLIALVILFTHFFINVGMNIGIVPVVGVTLPFVSYGGSSLLSNLILLGIVVGVNRSKEERNFLEIG
jgi:rod shape determining protein RodA